MTTTVTIGVTNLMPLAVIGYTANRTSGNIIHPILNRPDPDVTFKAPAPRTGRIVYLVGTDADAVQLEQLHQQIGIFYLTDTDHPVINMKYVLNGDISSQLDTESNMAWLVSVDFQEVL